MFISYPLFSFIPFNWSNPSPCNFPYPINGASGFLTCDRNSPANIYAIWPLHSQGQSAFYLLYILYTFQMWHIVAYFAIFKFWPLNPWDRNSILDWFCIYLAWYTS
jgi:hypothetical protein